MSGHRWRPATGGRIGTLAMLVGLVPVAFVRGADSAGLTNSPVSPPTAAPAAVTSPGVAPWTIDLPTALRLAGAENLEVQLARERVLEARAIHEQARLRYFPWVTPGVGYRGHDGSLQDVAGRVFDVSKQSYSAGAALTASVNYGEAIYEALAARHLAQAAEEDQKVRRRDAVFQAASRYFELARAVGAVAVAGEAVHESEAYADQVRRAVDAGIAFRGDVFRADVQARKNQVLRRQAEEQRRVAAARLAETLRLAPATDLILPAPELEPITLVETNRSTASLIAAALAGRPEIRQSSSFADSTETDRKAAMRGPWIPTLGAQFALGGFGGGPDDHLGSLGDTRDYLVGLSWRIGPGGLLDRGRVRAAEARQRTGLLEVERVRLAIQREVVEAEARTRSLADQVELARQAVGAAQELLTLTGTRKEFGVGAVLEAILAEEELTRTRLEFVRIVAEHNQAQYALRRAVGE